VSYKIVKERFLNWRQTFGHLKVKKETVPAHFLPYSTLKKNYSRGKIEYNIDNLYYMNRDEVKFITLEHYNRLTKSSYKNIIELIFNAPALETEIKLRQKLISNPFDLSSILVVAQIPTQKIEIVNISYIYEDVKEVLY
ncbi:MAG: diacylglucosamine hydrolase like protein, partial [Sulfurovaceae bacterium]|nr:diacylglucosamine hydrolase like protein [Sulfurovaceae bacterium]